MRRIPLFILYLLLSVSGLAQPATDTLNLDSVHIGNKDNIINKALKETIQSISNTPDRPKATVKSEDIFRKYNGRFIRHITYNQLGFEKRVNDTTTVRTNIGTRLMTRFHSMSKDWVIHDNLFTHEGDMVDAYKIADNERYIRTLPFMQDALIRLIPVKGHPDSVDMEVITRDVFSVGGKIDVSSTHHIKAAINDGNFLGMGQKLEFTGLLDQERYPKFGHQFTYEKYNVKGSFIDAMVGYSVMYPNKYDDREEEDNIFLQLNKALVSPYSKTAGGLQISYAESYNRYPSVRPDTAFYKYANYTFDVWGGYNLASKKLLHSEVRDRRFLAARYARIDFNQVPVQVGNRIDLKFNDVEMALASMTFFRQDFYKTNYVYGFGITEDIPYGYNIAVTAGWYRQLQLNRPYTGIKAEGYAISDHEDFYRYFFRLASFYNHGFEDAGLLVGGSWFSRLMNYGRYKARNFISLSYTHLFNTVTNEPLRIDNPFGLQYFSYQYIYGYDRIGTNLETTVFLPYKLWGFKFAPFANINISVITPPNQHFFKSDLYSGIGAGFRTRNENLVFGTIEVRGTYFPRKIDGEPSFKLSLTSNLRYKYSSKYVVAPDIMRWNIDDIE